MTEKTVVEQPNSVKFSINAKGQWSGEVKAYSDNLGDAYNEAKGYAILLEKQIKEKNLL